MSKAIDTLTDHYDYIFNRRQTRRDNLTIMMRDAALIEADIAEDNETLTELEFAINQLKSLMGES